MTFLCQSVSGQVFPRHISQQEHSIHLFLIYVLYGVAQSHLGSNLHVCFKKPRRHHLYNKALASWETLKEGFGDGFFSFSHLVLDICMRDICNLTSTSVGCSWGKRYHPKWKERYWRSEHCNRSKFPNRGKSGHCVQSSWSSWGLRRSPPKQN